MPSQDVCLDWGERNVLQYTYLADAGKPAGWYHSHRRCCAGIGMTHSSVTQDCRHEVQVAYQRASQLCSS